MPTPCKHKKSTEAHTILGKKSFSQSMADRRHVENKLFILVLRGEWWILGNGHDRRPLCMYVYPR